MKDTLFLDQPHYQPQTPAAIAACRNHIIKE